MTNNKTNILIIKYISSRPNYIYGHLQFQKILYSNMKHIRTTKQIYETNESIETNRANLVGVSCHVPSTQHTAYLNCTTYHTTMPRRRYRRVSDEDRERIIKRFEEGEDFLDTAAELQIPRTTAYEVIRKFTTTGERQGQQGRGGRPSLLDDEAKDFLVMLIEATPTITIKELNDTLRQTFPNKPHVCNATVSRALDGELITLKQVRNIPLNRNSESVKTARVAFANYMYDDGIHQHRVYIDETGYNLYTARTYGRARRGERVNRMVAGQRGNNVTLIAAVSNVAGMFYHEIHVTSVTKEIFGNFMTSLCAVLGPEEAVFFMDNAPCHADVDEEFEGHHVRKIPPYSPFLNPIENCFSSLKANVKRQLNNVVERCDLRAAQRHGVTLRAYRENMLLRMITTAIPRIDAPMCSANYRHSDTFLRKCLTRDDIWE